MIYITTFIDQKTRKYTEGLVLGVKVRVKYRTKSLVLLLAHLIAVSVVEMAKTFSTADQRNVPYAEALVKKGHFFPTDAKSVITVAERGTKK